MTDDRGRGRVVLAANVEAERRYQLTLATEDIIADFLRGVNQVMSDKGITRTELARRMNCSPSNVTQILRRRRNLTAARMADVAYHLGARVRLVVTPMIAAAILVGCGASDVPPNCVDIPCPASVSFPADRWRMCQTLGAPSIDVVCQLPTKPPVDCRIRAEDAQYCLCRRNLDDTTTALCVDHRHMMGVPQ